MASLSSVLKLTLLDGVTGPARRIQGVLSNFQRQQTSMLAPMRGIGGQLLAFGAGYLGVTKGISSTVGAAIEFESAFADVKKVVTASDEQFANMSRTIKAMSRDLPLTSVEIAQLFAAAGESGIATNELKSFAEMAGRVGIAFDMGAGEAGESLAKLKSQLGLTVAETGDLADAINHLSNNMASKAKDITAYMLKVGKFAEMGGFAKEQVAAIGSAMISAGAEADTAGTAMQNVVKKMTSGDFAKKDQREAAKTLGLDLPTLAKQMQKDAPGALKKVLKAIAKAPKDQQIALLSQFFGDEAKAFSPLVGNIGMLDDALLAVGDRSNYAGSAFKEFVARADTTSNALKILRNKISFVFEGIGEAWLPDIKEGIAAIGGVFDTLGERAGIFDEMSAGLKGFTQGLGFDGGVKEAIAAMGDLLFGEVDGDGAADKLGSIFKKFEGYGQTIRQFGRDVRDNPVVKFFGDLSPYYLEALKWSVGFLVVSAAIRKFASALWFLSGASTIVGAINTIGGIAGALGIGAGGLDKKIGAAGASSGAIYGKAFSLAAKAAIVAGIALITAELLQTYDPKGNLGGVTTPVDNWLRDKMGLPAKDAGITPGELWDGFGNILPKTDANPAKNQLSSVATDLGFADSPVFGDRGGGDIPSEDDRALKPVLRQSTATVGNDTSLPKKVGLLISALQSLPSQWQGNRGGEKPQAEEGGATVGTGVTPVATAGESLMRALGSLPALWQATRPAAGETGGSPKTTSEMLGGLNKPVTLDGPTISQLLQPSRGVQEVREVNKERPNVTVHAPVTISNISSPQEAMDAAASRLGQKIKAAVESSYSD